MYKKIILLFGMLYISIQYGSSIQSSFEIKPSYFLFSASEMKDIYNKGSFEIQGSGSIPFHRFLNAYASIGYRKTHGYTLETKEKTSLTLLPVDIGLKSIFNFRKRYYYFFATGPRLFYLHQKNTSPYINAQINNSGVGFFINTGFNIQIKDYFLLGIFGEYSYEKKTINSTMQNVYSNGSIQIGGWAFGASIGFTF